MLADLRESGAVEQDDVVAFMYRHDTYNSDSSEKGVAEIIVAKHRNGPTAKIRLAFLEHLTKFSDVAVAVLDPSGERQGPSRRVHTRAFLFVFESRPKG